MKASNITKQLCTQTVKDNRTIIKYGDSIRTRSGHISKKTGKIGIQIISNTGLADMSAAPTNVVWLAAIFHNSKCIFYDIFASWLT